MLLSQNFHLFPFLSLNKYTWLLLAYMQIREKGFFFWLYYQIQVWLLATQKTSNFEIKCQ